MFGTQKINKNGILEIGGLSVIDLKKEYETPLYIMDKKYIKDQIRIFKENFKSNKFNTEVAFASKSFMTVGMCKIVEEMGMLLDVVSGGELYTAVKAGFPMEKIHFHGNSKSIEELNMILDYGVGTIILDNHLEFEIFEKICIEKNKKIDAILRVNPGIDAHTHEYIQTTLFDSKFGESIFVPETLELIKKINASKNINFKGIHAHIGSQIFDTASFIKETEVMTNYIKQIVEAGVKVHTLNLGGGFGIFYTDGDTPVVLEECLQDMIKVIENINEENNLDLKEIQIEPGRSIVGNAGTTLYTIQGLKTTSTGKNYYFIDGGMTDNIRPALYQAKYTGDVANKMLAPKDNLVTVAGKCCESGDLIIKNQMFPKAEYGDLLCVYGTGAYNYSMANNYNRVPRPAVVIVEDGKAEIMVRRETYEDLIKNDVY